MKRFTRFLSIFLAVLMLSSVLTATASAITWDFDSPNNNNGSTEPAPTPSNPGNTGSEETSAIVRVYVQGTGTKNYSVGQVPGCSNLTVKEGYVIVKDPLTDKYGVGLKGIKDNDLANAESVIKNTATLIPTLESAIKAVNDRKTIDNNGATPLDILDINDYSGLAIDSVVWEKSDNAYHVHLTLVKKGELVITASSYTVTYDGNVHAADSYTYTGTPTNGHNIANVTLSGSGVDAGTYTLTASNAIIVDGNGNNVTSLYKITYVPGTLTITQRPLTITAGSNSWPYDGNWHSDNYWQVTSGTLADYEQVRSVTVTGSIRDEGSTANVPINASIYNNQRRVETTKNYDITYVNGTLTITGKEYTNNPEYVDSYITINKIDSDRRDLSGAKFTLYSSNNSPIYTTVETDRYGETTISTKDISKYLSDTAGTTYFTLRETQAPSGYTATNDSWDVKVVTSVSERYNNNEGKFTKVINYAMTVEGRDSVTVVNSKTQASKPTTASFTIYKQDSITGNALKGATFYLYDENYNTRYTSKLVASATSDSYGRVSFSGLTEGTYYLVEYSAPSGYTKDSTVYRINVMVPTGSDDNKLVAFIVTNNRSRTEADGYVIYNDRQQVITDTTSFTIIKRDSDYPYSTLSGAWFDLYDSSYVLRSGKYDTKAKPIDSQKTDKYGEATFSKLAAGTYYLVEYSAPSGYTKDSTVYRIEVRYPSRSSNLTAFIVKDNASSNRAVTEANNYVIYNTKTASAYGSVTISKEVSGIGTSSRTKYSFEIWEKNGKKALKSFSLTAGESTTINLDPGTYTIKELDASKSGYELKTYIDGSLSRTGQTSFTVKAGNKTKIAYKNVYAPVIDLNTDDHYAYIIGYEDGTVRPDGNLTRAEVATIFFRMLTDDARSKYWCTTNNYTDVSSDDWFNNAVSTLSYAGIINGYVDGSFQPKGTITRAELVKMAMGFFNYTTGSSSSRFTDVGDHWAASYINKAAELGYLDIFGTTFEPNKPITRAEAITIINRVLGRNPHKDYMNIRQTYWSDNPTSAWYYADIQEATNSHDYTWINVYGNKYEEWTGALENRDWAALEKQWSNTYSSHNPGNVW